MADGFSELRSDEEKRVYVLDAFKNNRPLSSDEKNFFLEQFSKGNFPTLQQDKGSLKKLIGMIGESQDKAVTDGGVSYDVFDARNGMHRGRTTRALIKDTASLQSLQNRAEIDRQAASVRYLGNFSNGATPEQMKSLLQTEKERLGMQDASFFKKLRHPIKALQNRRLNKREQQMFPQEAQTLKRQKKQERQQQLMENRQAKLVRLEEKAASSKGWKKSFYAARANNLKASIEFRTRMSEISKEFRTDMSDIFNRRRGSDMGRIQDLQNELKEVTALEDEAARTKFLGKDVIRHLSAKSKLASRRSSQDVNALLAQKMSSDMLREHSSSLSSQIADLQKQLDDPYLTKQQQDFLQDKIKRLTAQQKLVRTTQRELNLKNLSAQEKINTRYDKNSAHLIDNIHANVSYINDANAEIRSQTPEGRALNHLQSVIPNDMRAELDPVLQRQNQSITDDAEFRQLCAENGMSDREYDDFQKQLQSVSSSAEQDDADFDTLQIEDDENENENYDDEEYREINGKNEETPSVDEFMSVVNDYKQQGYDNIVVADDSTPEYKANLMAACEKAGIKYEIQGSENKSQEELDDLESHKNQVLKDYDKEHSPARQTLQDVQSMTPEEFDKFKETDAFKSLDDNQQAGLSLVNRAANGDDGTLQNPEEKQRLVDDFSKEYEDYTAQKMAQDEGELQKQQDLAEASNNVKSSDTEQQEPQEHELKDTYTQGEHEAEARKEENSNEQRLNDDAENATKVSAQEQNLDHEGTQMDNSAEFKNSTNAPKSDNLLQQEEKTKDAKQLLGDAQNMKPEEFSKVKETDAYKALDDNQKAGLSLVNEEVNKENPDKETIKSVSDDYKAYTEQKEKTEKNTETKEVDSSSHASNEESAKKTVSEENKDYNFYPEPTGKERADLNNREWAEQKLPLKASSLSSEEFGKFAESEDFKSLSPKQQELLKDINSHSVQMKDEQSAARAQNDPHAIADAYTRHSPALDKDTKEFGDLTHQKYKQEREELNNKEMQGKDGDKPKTENTEKTKNTENTVSAENKSASVADEMREKEGKEQEKGKDKEGKDKEGNETSEKAVSTEKEQNSPSPASSTEKEQSTSTPASSTEKKNAPSQQKNYDFYPKESTGDKQLDTEMRKTAEKGLPEKVRKMSPEEFEDFSKTSDFQSLSANQQLQLGRINQGADMFKDSSSSLARADAGRGMMNDAQEEFNKELEEKYKKQEEQKKEQTEEKKKEEETQKESKEEQKNNEEQKTEEQSRTDEAKQTEGNSAHTSSSGKADKKDRSQVNKLRGVGKGQKKSSGKTGKKTKLKVPTLKKGKEM